MRHNDQRGSILVYSLLLLAFTIAISLAMQSSALLEYQMSMYEHRANQARELAESAAWLALEATNRILREDFTYTQELPEQISLELRSPAFWDEDGNMEVSSISREQLDESSCTYSYTSTASYKGAEKTLHLKVLIDFEEFFYLQIDGAGNLYTVFSHRSYIDRGRFISFKETE